VGYSNAIFAQAYADQTAMSWLDGQHRAFVAWGGVPRVGVIDYVARHIIRHHQGRHTAKERHVLVLAPN